jgi:hypothetical protein
MVYDSTHGRMVLFGGGSPSGYLNDVWEFNVGTSTWTNVTPTNGPSPTPRGGHAMAYDPVRDKIVMHGGSTAPFAHPGDTWEWDTVNRSWTFKPNGGIGGGYGLVGSAMAFDPNRNEVVLFGGRQYFNNGVSETYAWNGNNWTNISPSMSPSGRAYHMMATDTARSKIVLFGGWQGNLLNDTWEWNGSTWSQITTTVKPLERHLSGFSYDSERGVMVLFGGWNGYAPQYLWNDTWTSDGQNWTQQQPCDLPSPRNSVAMAYDPIRKRHVMFGGGGSGGPTNETWFYGVGLGSLPCGGVTLISSWTMDGNIVDSVDNNNPSATNGTSFEPGRICDGVKLGPNGFIDIPDSGNLQNQHFTVSAWVRPDGPGSNNDLQGATFIQKGFSPPTGDTGLTMGMWWSAVDNRFRFGVGAPMNTITSNNTFPAGQFHHVAGTYDGVYLKLYVDGQLEAQTTLSIVISYDSSVPWTIGSSYSYYRSIGFPRTFNGVIDEVSIYNGALTSTDVQAIYNDTARQCPSADAEAPTTNYLLSPMANGTGWNNSDVSISLSASDNVDGSGVREITYSTSGAQTTAPTTVSGFTANLTITGEGETTIAYFATDNANNTETTQTLVVKVDKSAPSVSCGSADGLWHASNVTIPCSANDGVSGLADSGDSSFDLTTNVAANTETANASTNSRNVCDLAENCSTAGPVNDNKVDKKAPEITVTGPPSVTSGGQVPIPNVVSGATVTDNGSGVATIIQNPAAGTLVSLGTHTITITATDAVGNTSEATTTFTVNAPQLTALTSSTFWVGLKNSDDVGTKFDLLAEVLKNGVVVASGQVNGVSGGSSGFNNALNHSIAMALSESQNILNGDSLAIRLSVRVAANSGHVSGTARLWFNDSAANSGFGATINESSSTYYLRNGFSLINTPGPGPKSKIDVTVNRNQGGNPFKQFGTWTITF